jgi:Mn-dependent DtxR family transcriptional regulator
MSEKSAKEVQSYTLNTAFFLYALKKIERITRAVYLITNFFSEHEPLRWKLREENVKLLDHLSYATDSTRRDSTSIDVSFIKRSLQMILASLGVAHAAGLISEMNYAVIKNEYEGLLASFASELESDGNRSPLLFPSGFFEVQKELESKERFEKYLYDSAFEREFLRKDMPPVPLRNNRDLTQSAQPVDNSDKGQETSIKDIKDIKRTDFKKTSDMSSEISKTKRRDIILQLIKNRKEITVKDVANEIQTVSEKTLQRELISLVEEGTLERIGSRRWSRYRFS